MNGLWSERWCWNIGMQGPTDYGLATSATWFNQGGTKSAQGLATDLKSQSLATGDGRGEIWRRSTNRAVRREQCWTIHAGEVVVYKYHAGIDPVSRHW
jgi:hypothetical protein